MHLHRQCSDVALIDCLSDRLMGVSTCLLDCLINVGIVFAKRSTFEKWQRELVLYMSQLCKIPQTRYLATEPFCIVLVTLADEESKVMWRFLECWEQQPSQRTLICCRWTLICCSTTSDHSLIQRHWHSMFDEVGGWLMVRLKVWCSLFTIFCYRQIAGSTNCFWLVVMAVRLIRRWLASPMWVALRFYACFDSFSLGSAMWKTHANVSL